MSHTELCFMTATELVRRIRTRELSCKEVMEAHLTQIERINPIVNAIVTHVPHEQIMSRVQAADEAHSEGGWFEEQDEFPMPGLLAFPLSKEAERYYKHGPPFLQRFLPFWAASLVDRLKVMLLPLLVQ